MSRTELHDRVEVLLREMKEITRDIKKTEEEYNRVMEMITKEFQEKIAPLKEKFDEKEKELMKLAKAEKKRLFYESDVYETASGTLIREIKDTLKISRDTLRRCEELGFVEAIKIAKSLDRSVLERWPDERLFLVGARRELVERISYELK